LGAVWLHLEKSFHVGDCDYSRRHYLLALLTTLRRSYKNCQKKSVTKCPPIKRNKNPIAKYSGLWQNNILKKKKKDRKLQERLSDFDCTWLEFLAWVLLL
jgi:hypothetical protein